MLFNIVDSSTNKEALTTEKVRKNSVLPIYKKTVVSICMAESPLSPLYLLGNIQSGKSEKKL